MAQELYTSIAREYELARLAEVNDTPVITVLDAATVPMRRSAPRRTLLVLIAGMLAGVLALGIAIVEVKRGELARAHPEVALRFRRLVMRDDTRADAPTEQNSQ
jgi:uncharacterized protein involved in exopolysaccharide biosynthesis